MLSGAKTAGQLSLGKKVIITGLVVQVILFGLFLIVACVFHKWMNARPTSSSSDPQLAWRQYLKILYIASGLVLVRCLYRVIEYASSSEAFKGNEIYGHVFHAMLMLVIVVIYVVYYPSRLLQASKREESLINHLYANV